VLQYANGMTEAQTIYFDESGYTGNNLLSPDQPAFVYASVAIGTSDASHLHSEMLSRFQIKGKELKGKNLVKNKQGQEAISWLLNKCSDIACIVVANKKFALAGKFFEYIFEPVLKTNNSLFYAVGFHRFIANLLYILFESKDECAEDMLDEFETLMRTQDPDDIERLLVPLGQAIKFSDPLGQILTFSLCHKEKIKDEIKTLSEINGVRRWALELTTTSLFWMLSLWSERFDLMEVYCDKSEPLDTNRHLFDTMIGRQDRIYMKLGSEPERALTYNLAGPIILLDSQQSPGIQIADVLSSSIAFALKNPDDELSRKWLELAESMFTLFGILPDIKAVDLRERDPFINALILHELVDRTLQGKSLFVDMAEFIGTARRLYQLPPPTPQED